MCAEELVRERVAIRGCIGRLGQFASVGDDLLQVVEERGLTGRTRCRFAAGVGEVAWTLDVTVLQVFEPACELAGDALGLGSQI